MMAAPVTTGAKFDAGVPIPLFQASPRQQISSGDQFAYDVTRDGQRSLILTQIKNGQRSRCPWFSTGLPNWPSDSANLLVQANYEGHKAFARVQLLAELLCRVFSGDFAHTHAIESSLGGIILLDENR